MKSQSLQKAYPVLLMNAQLYFSFKLTRSREDKVEKQLKLAKKQIFKAARESNEAENFKPLWSLLIFFMHRLVRNQIIIDFYTSAISTLKFEYNWILIRSHPQRYISNSSSIESYWSKWSVFGPYWAESMRN